MVNLQEIRSRLQSTDFNSRIQAAAELGEEGTAEDAPILLRMTWEDEISNVRQFTVQAYTEILGDDAFEEIQKIIQQHSDEYVVQYAISTLGKMKNSRVEELLIDLLSHSNPKYRTTSLRSIIMRDSKNLVEVLFQHLERETDELAIRNCIEALGIWKYKKAKERIEIILQEISENLEIYTFALFALARFGDKKAKERLENDNIDAYARVTVNGVRYTGRKGLLLAIDK